MTKHLSDFLSEKLDVAALNKALAPVEDKKTEKTDTKPKDKKEKPKEDKKPEGSTPDPKAPPVPDAGGDPMAGLGMPGQPDPDANKDLDEPALLPYKDKVNMLIGLMKEYGYSNFKFSLDNGANALVVVGDIVKRCQEQMTKLGKDMKIDLTFTKQTVDEKEKLYNTRVVFKNTMDFETFKELWKIMKKRERAKEDLMMGGGAAV
jgi:hypothetical protein